MFPLVTNPNIHPSLSQQTLQTSRAALRKKNRVGLLIELRTGAAFYSSVSTSHTTPPLTLKSKYIFTLFKNQDKTGHFGGVQNKVRRGSKSKVEADTDGRHHGGGVRRVRMLISAAGEKLSRAAALGPQSANLPLLC